MYDLLGRLVRPLVAGPLAPGPHSYGLDGLGAGTYVVRLVSGGAVEATRFTVVR